jgi:AraC-like DNA-binding protein
MSIPSFHSHFKAITQVSPMQYVKSTRLHQARLLMVRQDLTAEAASHAAGYTSPSQFSREFKRRRCERTSCNQCAVSNQKRPYKRD